MIKGKDKVDHNKFFKLANTDRTRGHNLKLVKDSSTSPSDFLISKSYVMSYCT